MLSKSLIRRLDLITLQLFVAVYEEGTLTRAAARESIAVSAASKRLVDLEKMLGLTLFVRQAKGMSLTAAGETLLHHGRQMLFNVQKMGLELGEHSDGVRGYVRMLANLSAIIQFLPEDLRDFTARYPQLKTDLEERPSSGVVQGVLDGVADLGICSCDTDTKGLFSVTYRRDNLMVLMPMDHPLADRKGLSFTETLGCDYVGLHSASSINMRTHAAAREAGKMLHLRIHVPGFDAMCRMVQANMGIGILPQKAYELFGRTLGLRAVPLTDEWAARRLILVVRDEASLSPVSRLLFEYLQASESDI
ncbi:LysR family transcriptional regulator [Pseudomonas fluorescens]|uniref:LysR family transcriptional regulator n=1 Tax=Pseudomonas fluorescens TaxID=294 RepID=A0A379I9P7_PSEFL|nr:LysR family transcriptional regulator [Pseudomonas fluorescens]AIG05244.1 LysR family transcriptional regulator [Pseudomonas fluorescens]SUD29587.1 LysR family transcriptional regulator [Pseudomonas fluorescens]